MRILPDVRAGLSHQRIAQGYLASRLGLYLGSLVLQNSVTRGLGVPRKETPSVHPLGTGSTVSACRI